MATYYTSSSNQVDDMPGDSQRDSGGYPEGQVLSSNMMYLHPSNVSSSYSDSMPGSYQLQLNGGEHSSMGVSQSIPSRGNLSDLIGSHIEEPPYDVWRDGRNEFSFMHPMNGSTTIQSIGKQIEEKNDLASNSVIEDPEIGLHRGQNLQGQGLSLSLSTRIPAAVPVSLFQYQNPNLGLSSFFNSYPSTSGDGSNGEGSRRNDVIAQSGLPGNVGYFPTSVPRENHIEIKGETGLNMHSNRLSGLSSIIPNSKYLKVAQQLLDEVVDVRKAQKQEPNKQQNVGSGLKVSKDGDGKQKEDSRLPHTARKVQSSDESNANPAGELSPGNSQDLRNKITELLSMLEEVDRRYKQYYHQMQIVASYFDGIAGSGASKPYTTLALQTISRHFRCIRDAISGQIKATRSSLGEEDTAENTREGGISRLRFVEQKLRQHRALQQLGMMQQHAWRPQRGLPETSVTILRAWLFEHFLHPYPKDSDKILLSRQTGLTRGQVSNWFINARVRLWKPMIEDMYKEEIGDSEVDNSSSDTTLKAANHKIKVSEDMGEASQKNIYPENTEKRHLDQYHASKCDFTRDVEMSLHASGNCFPDEGHGQIETAYGGMKIMGEPRSDMANCRVPQDALFQSDGNAEGRFIAASTAYQMAELEMFGSQGGISLTLGLQHFDGSISDAAHHNFAAMRGADLYTPVTSSEPNNANMDCMDPDNQQYRFGNSNLLHDFVAQ